MSVMVIVPEEVVIHKKEIVGCCGFCRFCVPIQGYDGEYRCTKTGNEIKQSVWDDEIGFPEDCPLEQITENYE